MTAVSDATDHALQAAVKALAEVVSPAVNKADALAVDQLRLALSWLQFHGLRRHDERRFAWAGLRLRMALGREVLAVLEASALPVLQPVRLALRAQCEAGQQLLERAGAPGSAWREAGAAIDACACQAIDALAPGPPAVRDALAEVVLRHSRRTLMLHRAWFAPMGFEARPQEVKPLEEMLAGAPDG